MPKLYPAQPIKAMTKVQTPQKSNPLAGTPTMQTMGSEPQQGFLGNPQPNPGMANRQPLTGQGWRLGINLAQQYATSPSMQTNLAIRNTVTQPKQAAHDLLAMTDTLSRLALRPVPSSVMKALRL